MRVDILHKFVLIVHVKPVVIWVFRRIKTPMIILSELIDFIKVITGDLFYVKHIKNVKFIRW